MAKDKEKKEYLTEDELFEEYDEEDLFEGEDDIEEEIEEERPKKRQEPTRAKEPEKVKKSGGVNSLLLKIGLGIGGVFLIGFIALFVLAWLDDDSEPLPTMKRPNNINTIYPQQQISNQPKQNNLREQEVKQEVKPIAMPELTPQPQPVSPVPQKVAPQMPVVAQSQEVVPTVASLDKQAKEQEQALLNKLEEIQKQINVLNKKLESNTAQIENVKKQEACANPEELNKMEKINQEMAKKILALTEELSKTQKEYEKTKSKYKKAKEKIKELEQKIKTASLNAKIPGYDVIAISDDSAVLSSEDGEIKIVRAGDTIKNIRIIKFYPQKGEIKTSVGIIKQKG